MPSENTTPVTQTPETPPVQPDVLPDEIKQPEDAKLLELKQAHEKEKQDIAEQAQRLKEEKESLEKRLKDSQEYISRTRNLEKLQEQNQVVAPPHRTFDEYLGELDKMVDQEFENDPKQGLKKAVRKIVTDVAYDRDLQQKEYDKRILEAENRAFRRVLSLDPERSKIVQDVEKLDQERPDLSNLTFEQKVEWIRRGNLESKKIETTNRVNRDQELANDIGGGRNANKAERLPDWVNDRDVLAMAKDRFSSKKELADWANPAKAREMAKQMRPKSI